MPAAGEEILLATLTDHAFYAAVRRGLGKANIPYREQGGVTPRQPIRVYVRAADRMQAQSVVANQTVTAPLHRRLSFTERKAALGIAPGLIPRIATTIGRYRRRVYEVYWGDRVSARISSAIDEALLSAGLVDRNGRFIGLQHDSNSTERSIA